MAHLPRAVLRGICVVIGTIAMVVLPGRRRIVMSNLRHAFPHCSMHWCRKICRENFFRLIELGMLSISIGSFSKKKVRSSFTVSIDNKDRIKKMVHAKKGAIVLVPHVTLMEAMTSLCEILRDINAPKIGVIYRPLKNEQIDRFVKFSREKHGMRLLSRKNGFFDAMKILRDGGVVALLFDQSAGRSGYLMNFFERKVLSTDLPAVFFKKFGSPVYMVYPRRLGFWRASIAVRELSFDKNNPKTILFAANKFLEDILKSSDDACSDWLWAHNRWKVPIDIENDILGKMSRKNWLDESMAYCGVRNDRARKTMKIFVRMPNWLGDVVMAIPVIRMLRKSRIDAEITLLAGSAYSDFLEKLNISDRVITIPAHGLLYFHKFFLMACEYPDVYISLVNSLRGCIEATIINAPHRIGVETKKRFYRRIFFNHLFIPDRSVSLAHLHQTKLWKHMLKWYGFSGKIDISPARFCTRISDDTHEKHHDRTIGVICGSANNPEKRWPEESWRLLAERIFENFGGVNVVIYGTKSDLAMAKNIASIFGKKSVDNMAGKTDLLELASAIQNDEFIISIDTGGMHFVNLFGRPLICIFGPTNSLVTGPIFVGKKMIIRPTACPAVGGFDVGNVGVCDVFNAVNGYLKSGCEQ